MTLSRRQIPDAHATVEVDGTHLLHLREVSPFVMVLRLLVVALGRHPVLNSSWVDSDDGPQVHVHPRINLGVAVATTRGLVVVVLKDAQSKTTRELAAELDKLVGSARDGSIAPADLQGSTFTVSNFGSLGLDDGVPVINYPEAAILGVGALKERPVVVDGAVAVRPTMRLTCVFDHRVADGAQAAEFLCELRELIEAPETALLDF
jgi:pyruvate dehydrogenase E2 component (dihydrolipoamide acetyltransferase)